MTASFTGKYEKQHKRSTTTEETIQEWENNWLMEFRTNKCQAIHITNMRKPVRQPYNIHGHILEEVESAIYLGANIHQKLTF